MPLNLVFINVVFERNTLIRSLQLKISDKNKGLRNEGLRNNRNVAFLLFDLSYRNCNRLVKNF